MKFVKYLLFPIVIFVLNACGTQSDGYTTTNKALSLLTPTIQPLSSPTLHTFMITITPVPLSSPTMSPVLKQTSSPSPIGLLPTKTQPAPTIDIAPKIVPDELQKYIGIHYPPLPDNLVQSFGMLIVPSKVGEYSLNGIHQGDTHMLWLSKKIQWEVDGKWHQGWETLDILLLPPLEEEDDRLIPGGCKINGELDPEIIVIAVLDKEAYTSRYIINDKIKQAWRANRVAEAFEKIPTDDIECYADNATGWK